MKLYLILFAVLSCNLLFAQSQIIEAENSNSDIKPYINSIDSSFARCDSTWQTNVDWGGCIGRHIGLWDSLRYKLYDSLFALLDSTGKSLLKKSQNDWQNHMRSQQDFWSYFEYDFQSYFGREAHFRAMYYLLTSS